MYVYMRACVSVRVCVLGPFFLLVTSYKNTILRVNGSNYSPSFL